MVTIYIPKLAVSEIRTTRRVEATEGDLVLYCSAQHMNVKGLPDSAYLGVFVESGKNGNGKPFFKMDHPYLLKSPENFGGVKVNLVEVPTLPNGSRRFRVKERYSLTIDARIRVLEFGQEDVVRTLKGWPGYESHAEWVARLEKPYVRK